MIIVDFSQISLASILVNPKYYEDKDMVRYILLNSIRNINSRFCNEFGQMVLAVDSANPWRREVYPEYKAARRAGREKSSHDWNAMFTMLHEIRDEIRDNFPYKMVKVDRAEADDIIATLVKHSDPNEKVLIVSGDKDFQQLQKYPNVSQWDHQQKKMIKCDDAKSFLIEHIIRGDPGDGVPNILSDDDALINEAKRQGRMTAGKFKNFFDAAMFSKDFGKETYKRNYIRNDTVINLDNIPENMEAEILKTFEEFKPAPKSGLINYFIKNKLKKLMTNLTDF